MMDEQRRIEMQKKLDDEERVRQMREGGEEMRAELEMEQVERSKSGGTVGASGLTPEEERRYEMESGSPHRGLGETQQAQMAMWGKEGGERPSETKGATQKATEKSKGVEEFANRTGMIIGRAVRKTGSIAKELSSGFKKGMSPKHKETAPESPKMPPASRSEEKKK